MPDNQTYSEKELLLRIAEGDERAFQQLVHHYSDKVFFHVLTFVKTWHQAEEITQDIFLNIWQKRNKLADIDNLKGYIFIVSRNYVVSLMRKNIRPVESSEPVSSEISDNATFHYENKELGILIEKAIGNLPEQKRQVFRLIHQEGLTQEEVSQKLGIATRTVRWNLVSATNAIKDFLYRYAAGDVYLLFLVSVNFF